MPTFENTGALHSVNCEWCGLKMACSCWDGNSPDRVGHLIVLCPRCQVRDFTSMLFGEKTLREVLLSKIEQSKERPTIRARSMRPRLRVVSGEGD